MCEIDANHLKMRFVFPIIFNYRHYLELILKKYAIKYAENKEEYEKLGKNLGHNLNFYWDKVKPLLLDDYSDLYDIDELAEASESYI